MVLRLAQLNLPRDSKLSKKPSKFEGKIYSVDENLRPVHIPRDERDIILYLNLFEARWTPVAPRVIIDNTHSFYEPLNDKHPSIVYENTLALDGAIWYNYDVSDTSGKNVWDLLTI